MPAVRARSLKLTGHLEQLLTRSPHFIPLTEISARYPGSLEAGTGAGQQGAAVKKPAFSIITPSAPEGRGAQLSLLFLPAGSGVMEKVFAGLKSYGVIGDHRQPDVIRLAPVALYNSFEDCDRAVMYLERVFAELESSV